MLWQLSRFVVVGGSSLVRGHVPSPRARPPATIRFTLLVFYIYVFFDYIYIYKRPWDRIHRTLTLSYIYYEARTNLTSPRNLLLLRVVCVCASDIISKFNVFLYYYLFVVQCKKLLAINNNIKKFDV